MKLTHDEIRELLGAYALDAVEEGEREEIEAHLPACPQCRAEVAGHRETAAMLANVGGVAPTGVWDRIEAALEDQASGQRTLGPRRRIVRAAGAALAAAAVALVAILGVKVLDLDRRLDRVAGEEGLEAVAAAALLDPEATRLVLRSPDSGLAVDAVVLPDGTGYLMNDNLRALGSGRTYQLWAMSGGSAISAGVLGPDPRVAAFWITGAADALAITEEAVPGAVQPSGPPLVTGEIPSA